MKRRKFLKLLGWSPMMFLAPRSLLIKKKSDNTLITLDNSIWKGNELVGDGGYIVPKDIADKLIRYGFDVQESVTLKIKMPPSKKYRR